MNTDPTRNQSFYDLTDLNSLRQDALKSTGDANASEEALRKAAQQFESIFTQMMLSSMRKANEVLEDKDSPFNSSSVKFYRDMHDQQMSMQLSSEGSLGLADLIVQQLSPNRDGYMPSSVLRTGAELQSDRIANGEAAQVKAEQQPEVMESASKDVQFDDPESFVSQLWEHAKSAAAKIGLNPAVMVAQAALETGWGKHIIARQDGESSLNLFNIKADKRWQGDSASKMTLEFEQGLPVKKQASFRAYDSLKDSINDYVDFLQSNPRYQEALTKTDNPDQYLDALQQAGYATDPDYAEKIKRVLDRGEFQSMLSASVHQGVN
ncbi:MULTISPECIES: flagellar assembly peptidoglycan hydrolase FlgJ [Pseudoalteromonas]|uniref:Peptidoglycan hydrolase FlgJ n=1 Tax=Pseudoalteromonas rubra TaxID=43658 RepID=A0A5S3UXK2_9GAMM|nr:MULTISPECIES: flagellar assembly peptidoglycan hydrolase FlgJ [Pseudoalteromonas]MCG7563622.1 flagellar assembly peptidoglycan hydrolase FlgJ [Pseudoalteromonas sp. McH1-42]QPB82620.1 flagellar assembly peptidoglycan hydrolase FlgJ [Pseudoalteromonas rubra]